MIGDGFHWIFKLKICNSSIAVNQTSVGQNLHKILFLFNCYFLTRSGNKRVLDIQCTQNHNATSLNMTMYYKSHYQS